ncbi:MAG: hypothetical protein R3272_15620 [Candidatus Promineifilaceae bacterium]|nr:hypothetical protein [Candidatus Promineifilaceae bacterium]
MRSLLNTHKEDNEAEGISGVELGGHVFDAASLSPTLRRLNWLVPLSLLLLVIGYQLGPAHWIYTSLGYQYHIAAEILVFASAGPLLAFSVLYLLRRWLEERDTSEWQAQLLKLSREHRRRSRQLNDDTLQVLFAAGVMLDTLKGAQPSLDAELLARVEATESALQAAVDDLRSHLLDS